MIEPLGIFLAKTPDGYPHIGARYALGALAQLGERLICIQEVRSSILLGSTIHHRFDRKALGSVLYRPIGRLLTSFREIQYQHCLMPVSKQASRFGADPFGVMRACDAVFQTAHWSAGLKRTELSKSSTLTNSDPSDR